MKRTQLKRKTPLRKMSKKRASDMVLYRKLKKEYIANNMVCEVCKHTLACDIHHRKPLGRGGKLCDIYIFVAICRACHNQIHDNPAWAQEAGLIV